MPVTLVLHVNSIHADFMRARARNVWLDMDVTV